MALLDTILDAYLIEIDRSGGQGHDWRLADLTPDTAEEIAAEILDGQAEACDRYTATNGLVYRWRRA